MAAAARQTFVRAVMVSPIALSSQAAVAVLNAAAGPVVAMVEARSECLEAP
jgi:hypothetical protein